MTDPIRNWNATRSDSYRALCDTLAARLDAALPEAERRIWHAHPVWFLDGNPIVGYSELKAGIRLMFWSGADFDEPGLTPGTGKFKDASVVYTAPEQIHDASLARWLEEARRIQWDYKNLVKRKGRLERLTG